MNRDILEQPFEAALIKSRRGAFGKTLSYVEGADYIRRLNDAFEAEWSFEVVEHRIYDTEVVVVGKLVAGDVVKTAFGGSSITTNTQTGELISIADDLKAAATDALKKAASLLGIGLHLYSEPVEQGRGNGVPAVPRVPPSVRMATAEATARTATAGPTKPTGSPSASSPRSGASPGRSV